MPVIDRTPYPEDDFVRAWLREKDAATDRRVAWQVAIAVITMIAACIAAWPASKNGSDKDTGGTAWRVRARESA